MGTEDVLSPNIEPDQDLDVARFSYDLGITAPLLPLQFIIQSF